LLSKRPKRPIAGATSTRQITPRKPSSPRLPQESRQPPPGGANLVDEQNAGNLPILPILPARNGGLRRAGQARHMRVDGRLSCVVQGAEPAPRQRGDVCSRTGLISPPWMPQRFYPASLPASERLTHYSRAGMFSCVEVDSSTYAIPAPRQMRGWASQVPARAPRQPSHRARPGSPDARPAGSCRVPHPRQGVLDVLLAVRDACVAPARLPRPSSRP